MKALVLDQPSSGAMPVFQTLAKPHPGPGETVMIHGIGSGVALFALRVG